MRRDPQAILAAHRMDPQRRELYVEGRRDVAFFSWALAGEQSLDARVIHAGFIDIAAPTGGERARLLAFASVIADAPVAIRVFVDADFDRILGVRAVPKVTMTDGRDMEGYILNDECIDKFVRLGLSRTDISAQVLLSNIYLHGRRLGLLRLASLVYRWQLPFQDVRFHRYVEAHGASISVDYDALIQTLLQNTGRGMGDRARLLGNVDDLEKRFVGTSDAELTHGKDALIMLGAVCHSCGIERTAAEPMFWTAFERSLVERFTNLADVCSYMRHGRSMPSQV